MVSNVMNNAYNCNFEASFAHSVHPVFPAHYELFASMLESLSPSLLPRTDIIHAPHDKSASQNTSGSSVFRHADVRKVAFIAFGDGNSDITLRASAVRQLKGMLLNNYLIQTAETSWCVNLASEMGAILNNAVTIYGQLSNKEYSPSIQKVALTKALTLAIQKALHAASHDTDSLIYLIDAYTSCITAESVAAPGLKVKALGSSYYNAVSGAKDSGIVMEEMSPPNLVSWIWDSFGSKPEVSAAVVRCLGRMGAPVPIAPALGGGLSKRLLPNVVAESPMRLMHEAAVNSSDAHPAVEQAVIVALWSILSNSEQARSIFKGMGLAANLKYAENSYDEGSYVDAALSRGQEALQLLLQ